MVFHSTIHVCHNSARVFLGSQVFWVALQAVQSSDMAPKKMTARASSPRGARAPSPRGARPPSARPTTAPAAAAPKKAGGGGGPKSWPVCEFCGQQFSPSSLPIHQKKCAARPDLKEVADAVAELAKLEGPRPLDAVADWQQCPNCGEQYGEFALPPHMKRCKRLLPFGKIKDGKQYGSGPPAPKAEAPAYDDFGTDLTAEELERIRALFDKHDADGNERLDEAELGALLRECFPARLSDAERLLAEFKVADLDGDGEVRISTRPHLSQSRVCSLSAVECHRVRR